MKSFTAVTLFAANIVGAYAQTQAYQKAEYCYAAARCYINNPICAREYCAGPPGISSCVTAGPGVFIPYEIPVRNNCCSAADPNACYHSWVSAHASATVDGSSLVSPTASATFSTIPLVTSGSAVAMTTGVGQSSGASGSSAASGVSGSGASSTSKSSVSVATVNAAVPTGALGRDAAMYLVGGMALAALI